MWIKSASFNVWVRYFEWNFKGTLWNSTQNIWPIHWKIWFLYNNESLRALRFKSPCAFFKRPPGPLTEVTTPQQMRLRKIDIHEMRATRLEYLENTSHSFDSFFLLCHREDSNNVNSRTRCHLNYWMFRFNYWWIYWTALWRHIALLS